MKIAFNVCRNELGECSDKEYVRYKEAVKSALEAEFPGAKITVGDSGFANVSQRYVTDYEEDTLEIVLAVDRIANEIFESGVWWD